MASRYRRPPLVSIQTLRWVSELVATEDVWNLFSAAVALKGSTSKLSNQEENLDTNTLRVDRGSRFRPAEHRRRGARDGPERDCTDGTSVDRRGPFRRGGRR